MKVLNVLTLLLVTSSFTYADDTNSSKLDEYISDLKRKEFKLDRDKSEADSSKLRDSWISPLHLNYGISRANSFDNPTTSQNAGISIDQPIFRSGGIYFGIKYANASRDFLNLSISQQERAMIKQAVSLLMNIKKSQFGIEKQELQIANSQINMEQKKEQYLNGQLDSGFLNNAIIERNVVEQKLYDLQTALERLISQFESISDLDYKDAKVPHLTLLNQEEFIKNNIDVKVLDAQINRDYYNKNVTIAKYLPKVSLQGSYNWQKNEQDKAQIQGNDIPGFSRTTETDFYSYGAKISMPLDINTFSDIESSKAAYLKSQVLIQDKKREQISLFDQVNQNIANIEKKILLAKKNKELYEKLSDETVKLFKAGYKTQYDVDNLKNSVAIQDVDMKIFDMEKQLELLNLYEKITK